MINPWKLQRCTFSSTLKKVSSITQPSQPRVRRAYLPTLLAKLSPQAIKHDSIQRHHIFNFDITFLGSGSSAPTKSRGHPCVQLSLDGEAWIFDAGEGSVRQSLQCELSLEATRTSRIFITHLHLDHIAGLHSIILRSFLIEDENTPLKIYGPPGILSYVAHVFHLSRVVLRKAIHVHELMFDAVDVSNTWSKKDYPWKIRNHEQYLHHFYSPLPNNIVHIPLYCNKATNLWECVSDDRVTVHAGFVSHSIPCFGYSVVEIDKAGPLNPELPAAFKVSGRRLQELQSGYSVLNDDGVRVYPRDLFGEPIKGRKMLLLGDTFDASKFVSKFQDCDLLIHEASALSSQEATSKSHSSPVEAVAMAKLCGARRLVMNHIGASYLPHPVKLVAFDGNSDEYLLQAAIQLLGRKNHVAVARDFMTVSVPAGGYSLHDERFDIRQEKFSRVPSACEEDSSGVRVTKVFPPVKNNKRRGSKTAERNQWPVPDTFGD